MWTLGAGAQGIAVVSEGLAREDSGSGARVEVRIADDAAAAVRSADHGSRHAVVTEYGVSLLRDNSQNARANARAVETQFSELYPDVYVETSYESPWFKVEAGRFVYRIEAEALRGRVSAQFPKAVVVQREVTLDEIVAVGKTVQAVEIQE